MFPQNRNGEEGIGETVPTRKSTTASCFGVTGLCHLRTGIPGGPGLPWFPGLPGSPLGGRVCSKNK